MPQIPPLNHFVADLWYTERTWFDLEKSIWLTYYTIIVEKATFVTKQSIISILLVPNKVLYRCITHSIARSIMFSTAATEVLWISLQFSWLVFLNSEDELSPIQHTQKHSTGPVLMSRNVVRIVVNFITVPVTSYILFFINKYTHMSKEMGSPFLLCAASFGWVLFPGWLSRGSGSYKNNFRTC